MSEQTLSVTGVLLSGSCYDCPSTVDAHTLVKLMFSRIVQYCFLTSSWTAHAPQRKCWKVEGHACVKAPIHSLCMISFIILPLDCTVRSVLNKCCMASRSPFLPQRMLRRRVTDSEPKHCRAGKWLAGKYFKFIILKWFMKDLTLKHSYKIAVLIFCNIIIFTVFLG